jgi:hypothetical protein
LLRASRDDRGSEIRRAEGGHLVVRRDPVRSAVRVPAVRRPRHPSALQQDHERQVRQSQLLDARGQAVAPGHPQYRPRLTHDHRTNQEN